MQPTPEASFNRAFKAIETMWGRRYDTDCNQIPDAHIGESFGCPVAVDLGDLAVAYTELSLLKHRLEKNRKG
jgi:hypothetical protein